VAAEAYVNPVFGVNGVVHVPGDKGISHRALLIGALARGRTALGGLAPGDDVARTAGCLRACGVELQVDGEGRAVIEGRGLEPGLRAPGEPLECGNSGSTMRMLAGILAGHPFTASLDGDVSLRRRPMRRVATPLRQMGAAVRLGPEGTPPITIEGRRPLSAISFTPEVASAQVKTAVLFAGLFAETPTTVVEPVPTRDHTERLLRLAGVEVDREGDRITLWPGSLGPFGLDIPGDVSSAAYFLCLAAAREGWRARCPRVGLNPGRDGFLEVLREMGAEVDVEPGEPAGGTEPVGDVEVRGRGLRATTVAGAIVPRLIDELPVLAVLATQAEGTTEIRDAEELRIKESDRITHLVTGLRLMGARCEQLHDGLIIDGPASLHPAAVEAEGDHRLAMAFAIAACLATAPGETRIAGAESVDVSYPSFFQDLAALTAAGPA
jgi:3-phosphoshikimate 1-carboxyvinyltransferase